jgi:cellulose synthase/poly-beta-1,6-N-acetylglucosamine synthase-like glycosyltransferase
MNWTSHLFLGIFFLNLACVFMVFLGYPLVLYICSLVKKKYFHIAGNQTPWSVSVIVVFRNAESLIEKKIQNFLTIDYPKEKIELILVSDGSSDHSLDVIQPYLSPFIRLFHSSDHKGKAYGLNLGVEKSKGDILVFCDADSILEQGTVKILLKYFSDPAIGGVCGQRMITEEVSHIKSGQKKYIAWDSLIKSLEVKCGLSITSHDGKLYAIRKQLFQPVPDGVTDDAYISLSVIGQNFRFVFDPEAKAVIKTPSRNERHELKRRARIVSRSLNGLKMNKKLLNPLEFGFFAMGLFINKVLRRVVPISLGLIFLASWILSRDNYFLGTISFWLQVTGYSISLLYPVFCMQWFSKNAPGQYITKISSVGFFFCLGMIGTLFGIILFLSGAKITKWDPEKG